ncbi:hypothetical protein [Nocardioides dongkuii]|uniref:hypothetical protein n=1 Tax=Nocardioides dongkuii TaxID=2760089 RepID=UPI0015F9364F|nr:hypothetical protein [Nocardioides dongkuii]
MFSTKLSMTAQNPSSFALPTCGHAFWATFRGTDLGVIAGIGTSVTARVRQAVEGGMDIVPTYVPGTLAWSPPTS